MEVRHVILIIVIIVLLLVIWYNSEKWKSMYKTEGGMPVHNTYKRPIDPNIASVSMYIWYCKARKKYFLKIGALSNKFKFNKIGEFASHAPSSSSPKVDDYKLVGYTQKTTSTSTKTYKTTDYYTLEEVRKLFASMDFNDTNEIFNNNSTTTFKSELYDGIKEAAQQSNVHFYYTSILIKASKNGKSEYDAGRIASTLEGYLHLKACEWSLAKGFCNAGDKAILKTSDDLKDKLHESATTSKAIQDLYGISMYNHENYYYKSNRSNGEKKCIELYNNLKKYFIKFNELFNNRTITTNSGTKVNIDQVFRSTSKTGILYSDDSDMTSNMNATKTFYETKDQYFKGGNYSSNKHNSSFLIGGDVEQLLKSLLNEGNPIPYIKFYLPQFYENINEIINFYKEPYIFEDIIDVVDDNIIDDSKNIIRNCLNNTIKISPIPNDNNVCINIETYINSPYYQRPNITLSLNDHKFVVYEKKSEKTELYKTTIECSRNIEISSEITRYPFDIIISNNEYYMMSIPNGDQIAKFYIVDEKFLTYLEGFKQFFLRNQNGNQESLDFAKKLYIGNILICTLCKLNLFSNDFLKVIIDTFRDSKKKTNYQSVIQYITNSITTIQTKILTDSHNNSDNQSKNAIKNLETFKQSILLDPVIDNNLDVIFTQNNNYSFYIIYNEIASCDLNNRAYFSYQI